MLYSCLPPGNNPAPSSERSDWGRLQVPSLLVRAAQRMQDLLRANAHPLVASVHQSFQLVSLRPKIEVQRCHGKLVSAVIVEPQYGEMAEWLKAHAWKACIPQGIQGSNPCLSATSF